MTMNNSRRREEMEFSRPNNPFFMNAISPGFYGNSRSQKYILVPNNKKEVETLRERFPAHTLCVFDTGGFSLREAISFHVFTSTSINRVLSNRPKTEADSNIAELYVPISIARACHWDAGDEIDGVKVKICGDDFHVSDQEESVEKHFNFLTRLLTRFLTGGRLMLAQILFFAIPAVIIRLDVFVSLLVLLLSIAVLLWLFWDILPGKGWIKGTIGGGLFATIWITLSFVLLLTAPVTIFLLTGVIILLSSWLGFVFSGTKIS